MDQAENTDSSTELTVTEGIILEEEAVKGRKDAVSDIELENLIKIYSNGETAVNGLSMRAVRGQISVLLGHNGCGKGTTFGMITGILQPTSGTITIEGVDAIENRKVARESIGYCPQYNPLYEKLTVMEHLRLVNTLKGGNSEGFEEDADNLLNEISLIDKKNVQAKKLSGGMKRKLSVCMAMIRGSRVVLLDEPTAGMDPGARLDVQKILNKVKSKRTILLTTHYMDEAEKLGDWVFVMSHGKMAASGSLPFLKNKSILEKQYDSAYLKDIPVDLMEQIRKLKIVTMGISVSSLEQVFIKIEKECDRVLYGIDDEERIARAEQNFNALAEAKREHPIDGQSLIWLQGKTILYKRFIHLLRNPSQLIISSLNQFPDSSALVNNFNLSGFPPSKVILQFDGPPDNRIVEYLNQFKHLEIIETPMKKKVSALVKNQTISDKKIGLVISVYKHKTIMYYHERTSSCLPIALNLLSNLKYLRINKTSPIGNNEFFYILGVMLSLTVIPAVLFLIEEKSTKFQHQQMLTGMSPFVFWSGSLLWDHILFMIAAVYTVVIILVFEVFSNYNYLIFFTLYFFFFSTASFVYLVSVFVKTPTVGSTFLVFFRIFTAVIGFAVYSWYLLSNKETLLMIRQWYAFGLLDPSLILMYGMNKIYMCQARLERAFSTARTLIFGFDTIFEFHAIWIDWLYLILLSVLFFSLFIGFRSRLFKRLLNGFKNSEPREKKRYKLVKDFGKLRAVNGLTITVREKECFGLLGQNGAGKTTSFDMLTGLSIPSGGTATIAGEKITHRIQIGYCPQFDTLMSQFSGRQCLRIIAQLQGYSNIEDVIEMVLTCIGMTDHADKKIQHCSGGQKRKISVGIALMSRSPCVMLDEPTAGIDPRARREIWDILHNMREKANSSIVLTSHSMDECEALCTRIGILREGDMIAVGSSQELKSKFGNFYLLTMVLQNLEQSEQVKTAVSEKWSDAILKTDTTSASLNIVYQMEDFMLSQATLEDAFIRLNTI
ncbi:hypothetical protein CAEBREN_08786 [Caenorhabditis brenneri]|uniref:ABC transporter domain-containing protein n=1 Tax=Caenorhabditis brenneri TaxID=135651 RepID=G0PH72_CAEBE|nr:hypothetical protein CAEBREN_08786 [Caenorhabditis brenneri]